MTAYGFFVNTDICTGCKACMTSCFDRNDLEVPQKFRKVYEFGGGTWSADEAGAYTRPNVVFKPHRDADKGGVLANPLEVGHER